MLNKVKYSIVHTVFYIVSTDFDKVKQCGY